MATSNNTVDPSSSPPDAEAIHRAIRAIVDARATGSAASWDGMELLEAACGENAFRHPVSIFRDNDAAHGRAARPLPPSPYRLVGPGNKIEWITRVTVDVASLTNDQVAALKDSRIDPTDGTVITDTGQLPDPQVEGAARVLRKRIVRTVEISAIPIGTNRHTPELPGPQGAERDGWYSLSTAHRVSRLLEAGDEDGAGRAVLLCAAECGNGRLSASSALATAGFLLGVRSVHWAALGLASRMTVIACSCTACDPPDHPPRQARQQSQADRWRR